MASSDRLESPLNARTGKVLDSSGSRIVLSVQHQQRAFVVWNQNGVVFGRWTGSEKVGVDGRMLSKDSGVG